MIRHQVIIRYGDLPPRIEGCSLRGCIVSEKGLTTCEHIACPTCGCGPPNMVQLADVPPFADCEQCGYKWRP